TALLPGAVAAVGLLLAGWLVASLLRGLTLREITLRHWARVVFKEFSTGLLNGLGVALVTCAGVYVWSGSTGIVLVIGISMVLSMSIAGVAGALIPILLSMLGQDPA
ncbi:MAG: magnesium transporter, partial [Nitrospinae bacterium]|nr:magnesium transporter [Nitrospinota bacterium]